MNNKEAYFTSNASRLTINDLMDDLNKGEWTITLNDDNGVDFIHESGAAFWIKSLLHEPIEELFNMETGRAFGSCLCSQDCECTDMGSSYCRQTCKEYGTVYECRYCDKWGMVFLMGGFKSMGIGEEVFKDVEELTDFIIFRQWCAVSS